MLFNPEKKGLNICIESIIGEWNKLFPKKNVIVWMLEKDKRLSEKRKKNTKACDICFIIPNFATLLTANIYSTVCPNIHGN